jgi:uncharacterized membrane protein YfcA
MSSTILHPVEKHTWWYAAAAVVAAGLLLVLIATVFGGSGSVATTPPPISLVGHSHVYAPPCFAGHPNMSIELARSGCRA